MAAIERFLGSPQLVRYISMKDEKQILPGTLTAGAWTVLADSGAVLVGLFGRTIFELEALGGNADNILPELAQGSCRGRSSRDSSSRWSSAPSC